MTGTTRGRRSDGEVCVLTHGHCFDGLASAVVFTQFLSELRDRPMTRWHYRSCGYGPKLATLPESWLRGAENALLDFRYSDSARLGWYFDHHATSFESELARVNALGPATARSGRRVFHDPKRPSCAGFVASIAESRFGVKLPALGPLVAWADIIDAARFDDPESAYFARSGALQVADVVERHGDGRLLSELVPLLLERSLDEVAALPVVRERAVAIAQNKASYLETVRRAGELREDVALVDLTGLDLVPAGKFPQYVAFPKARYAVTLQRTPDQIRLSIGFNPWSGRAATHDASTLCRPLGGGGHANAAGAAFARDDLERARAAALRIVDELQVASSEPSREA